MSSKASRFRTEGYRLIDPRPLARRNPYTFILPGEQEIDSLEPGDTARLIFQSVPPLPNANAERMWVIITECGSGRFLGTLDNEPIDTVQLRIGALVRFSSYHVIDFARVRDLPDGDMRKRPGEYWDFCEVDDCVLRDGVKVGSLFREKPRLDQFQKQKSNDSVEVPEEPRAAWDVQLESNNVNRVRRGVEGENRSDSGWRVRGDRRGLTDAQIAVRKVSRVALCAVLECDDSWLPLIDDPVGSEYVRDFLTGQYRQV